MIRAANLTQVQIIIRAILLVSKITQRKQKMCSPMHRK